MIFQFSAMGTHGSVWILIIFQFSAMRTHGSGWIVIAAVMLFYINIDVWDPANMFGIWLTCLGSGKHVWDPAKMFGKHAWDLAKYDVWEPADMFGSPQKHACPPLPPPCDRK